MPVANGISVQRAVPPRGPSKHVPLAKCRVLYIGCAVPLKTSVGLEAVQKPLSELYPVAQDGKVDGIDAWVTIFTSGIHLQYVGEQDSTIWFPIQNLYVCAAVKCMVAYNTATDERVARFVSLDSDPAKGTQSTSHPPMFSAILRRSQGVKVLECHGFIVKSNRAALSMVKACTYAYQHEENWTDEPPPVDVLQNEIRHDASGSDSAREDSSLKRIDMEKGGYFHAGDGMIKTYNITNGINGVGPSGPVGVMPPRFVAPPGAILRPGIRPPLVAVRPGMPPPRMMVPPGMRVIGPRPSMVRVPPPGPMPPPGRTYANIRPPELQPATIIHVGGAPPAVEASGKGYRYTIKRTDSVSSRSTSSSPPLPEFQGRAKSPKRKLKGRSKSRERAPDAASEQKMEATGNSNRKRHDSDSSMEIIYTSRQQKNRRPPSPPVDYTRMVGRMSRRDEFEAENGDAHLELERHRGPGRPVFVYYPEPDPRSRSMYVRGPFVEQRYIPPGVMPPPQGPRPYALSQPDISRAKSLPPHMIRNRSPSPMRVKDKKSKKNKRRSNRLTRYGSTGRRHSDHDVPVGGFNSEIFMKTASDPWENARPRDWQNEERQFGNERAFGQSLKHYRNMVDNDEYNAYDINREGPTSPEPGTVPTDNNPVNGSDNPVDDMERTFGYLP